MQSRSNIGESSEKRDKRASFEMDEGLPARTSYDEFLSSLAEFEQGTPQGNALSPLLFNLAMGRFLEVPSMQISLL